MIKLVKLNSARISEEITSHGIVSSQMEFGGIKKFCFYQQILKKPINNIEAIRRFQESDPYCWS